MSVSICLLNMTKALIVVVVESMEPSVPPGFRFHPTDEELVGYYLKKKVASQKIDLDVIRDIDLYRIEPWDLQEPCRIGYEEQNEWYFFSHKDKKYPTGTRTNRATMAGFWKATGRDKAVYDKMRLIGMRKTLVFYKGRAPNGQKTDWIMHEYRLESDENGPPQEEGWVVCRAFKKRTTSSNQTKNMEGWDSTYFYDESSGVSALMDYAPRQQQQHHPLSFMCKQESDHHQPDHLSSMHSDYFVHDLPQLESPSLPLLKRPSMICEENIVGSSSNINNNNNLEKATDWRALDKFVASQLSHDQENSYDVERERVANFGGHSSDLALLLLQNGNGSRDQEQEENKLNGFLSSDCDVGICIFDK